MKTEKTTVTYTCGFCGRSGVSPVKKLTRTRIELSGNRTVDLVAYVSFAGYEDHICAPCLGNMLKSMDVVEYRTEEGETK